MKIKAEFDFDTKVAYNLINTELGDSFYDFKEKAWAIFEALRKALDKEWILIHNYTPTQTNTTPDDMLALARETAITARKYPVGAVILIAETNFVFGQLRMFAMFREEEELDYESPYPVFVVRTMEEAEAKVKEIRQ